MIRSLYRGDCLTILNDYVEPESVNLVYLDPPFNSKSTYNLPFKKIKGTHNTKAVEAFTDTWTWQDTPDESGLSDNDRLEMLRNDPTLRHVAFLVDFAREQDTPKNSMGSYILSMIYRLQAIRRVLKPTGSVYLHCDPTANYFLRLVMDCVFGRSNYRNEIVWCYTGPGSPNMRQFNRKHETIFWYNKGKTWTFNRDAVRVPHKKLNTNNRGAMIDAPLTEEERDKYLDMGKVPETWWSKFSPVGRIATERLGYPTQKPLALLERIIKASSNPDDIVLDPFCGCGTTVHAAESLGRQWIGIDISRFSIGLINERIVKNFPGNLSQSDVKLFGLPETINDAKALAKQDPFEFQKWVCGKIGANGMAQRRGADGGIDGIMEIATIKRGKVKDATAIVQVKGGNVTADSVRALDTVVRRSGSMSGIMVCFENQMRTVGNQKGTDVWSDDSGTYPVIQGFSIEQLIKGETPHLPPLYGRRRGGRISA